MENFVFKNTSKEDIPEIAKMRMSYKDRLNVFFNEIPSKRLIEDYFYFYLDNYPESFWTVFEQDIMIGYIIITQPGQKNLNKIILKGYFIKWFFSWIIGEYGISLKSVIKSLLRVFSSNAIKVKLRNNTPNNTCYIASIGVRPDLRGRGIAKKMLEYAFEYAKKKGNDEIWLKVGKDNIPAFKLFQKAGFKIVYEKNNFFVMSYHF